MDEGIIVEEVHDTTELVTDLSKLIYSIRGKQVMIDNDQTGVFLFPEDRTDVIISQ